MKFSSIRFAREKKARRFFNPSTFEFLILASSISQRKKEEKFANFNLKCNQICKWLFAIWWTIERRNGREKFAFIFCNRNGKSIDWFFLSNTLVLMEQKLHYNFHVTKTILGGIWLSSRGGWSLGGFRKLKIYLNLKLKISFNLNLRKKLIIP